MTVKDDLLLDIQYQAEQLGGFLGFVSRGDGIIEIAKMRLPRWEGERAEFFQILCDLSDRSETPVMINPQQAISAGERKIALSELESAGFLKNDMTSDRDAENLVRLPVPAMAHEFNMEF